MKTREEVLLDKGWKVFKGFCFPSPRAEEQEDLTFVEEKEALRVISEGVKNYWTDDFRDQIYDLDTAWEYLYDDWCDEHLNENQDIEFKDWELKMLEGE